MANFFTALALLAAWSDEAACSLRSWMQYSTSLSLSQYKRTVPHECSFTIPPYIHPDVYDAQLLPDLVAKPDACSSSSSCGVLMQQQEARSSLAATVVDGVQLLAGLSL